jgi:hypothetical protein
MLSAYMAKRQISLFEIFRRQQEAPNLDLQRERRERLQEEHIDDPQPTAPPSGPIPGNGESSPESSDCEITGFSSPHEDDPEDYGNFLLTCILFSLGRHLTAHIGRRGSSLASSVFYAN